MHNDSILDTVCLHKPQHTVHIWASNDQAERSQLMKFVNLVTQVWQINAYANVVSLRKNTVSVSKLNYSYPVLITFCFCNAAAS